MKSWWMIVGLVVLMAGCSDLEIKKLQQAKQDVKFAAVKAFEDLDDEAEDLALDLAEHALPSFDRERFVLKQQIERAKFGIRPDEDYDRRVTLSLLRGDRRESAIEAIVKGGNIATDEAIKAFLKQDRVGSVTDELLGLLADLHQLRNKIGEATTMAETKEVELGVVDA